MAARSCRSTKSLWAVSRHFLVIDLGQMNLDRLGDKLRDRRAGASELVVVVHRQGARLDPELARHQPGIGARRLDLGIGE